MYSPFVSFEGHPVLCLTQLYHTIPIISIIISEVVIMTHITENQFKELVKSERANHFITPFELVYKTFMDLGYDKKDCSFFMEQASEYIVTMREQCWNEFVPFEKEFTTRMLSHLIDVEKVSKMNPVDAIKDFTMEYPGHIYNLALSNTQSRRSRAGKEFEAIIELLLIGAEIPFDAQGAIGKHYFQTHQIGKLVDFVSPSVAEYLTNKRNTMLISAKTTLRERWQEVPEEVNRTGIREMYLATLDDNISDETLRIMYEANVIVVTTRMNKENNYARNNHVITFEEMLAIGRETVDKWNNYQYSNEDKDLLLSHIKKQIEKFDKYPYVKDYYAKRLNVFS